VPHLCDLVPSPYGVTVIELIKAVVAVTSQPSILNVAKLFSRWHFLLLLDGALLILRSQCEGVFVGEIHPHTASRSAVGGQVSKLIVEIRVKKPRFWFASTRASWQVANPR